MLSNSKVFPLNLGLQCYIIAVKSQKNKTIISVNFSSIKNIIFDLGGVIINIDFKHTYEAFSKLTNANIEEVDAKMKKIKVFERYECGEFTDAEFRDFLRKE